MTEFVILDGSGLPITCQCGKPAAISHTSTTGRTSWYCRECNPAGSPCPLCGGTGLLPRYSERLAI